MIKHTIRKPIIEVDHLSKVYPPNTSVFSNLNFKINKNTLTIIKGPSGCGKSTLLRIIAGLDTATEGTVYIDGEKATSKNEIKIPPYNRTIGFLFQDLALWPHMTGSQQLEFVWSCKYSSPAKYPSVLNNLLHEVGIANNLLSRYPHQLSRGQQQRLAIVRTLIASPQIVLLDEPFTGLDQDLRGLFIKLIQKLRAKPGTTILLVTHDLFLDLISPDLLLSYRKGTFETH